MKKSIWIVVLLSLVFMGCPLPPEYRFDKISYRSTGRGGSETITIQKEEKNFGKALLVYSKNNTELLNQPFSQFKELYATYMNVNLDSIGKLEVPSKKHQYDGARYTIIEFQILKKTYKSVGFDHNNPPKELKPLADYLQSLIK